MLSRYRALIAFVLIAAVFAVPNILRFALGQTPSGVAIENSATASPEAIRGHKIFLAHCAGCHGPQGKGDGPAAKMLYPPPRDFTDGEFKFSSRATPGLPTDDDLLQLLTRGLKGTAMPSFRFLPEADLRALIAHLKTLSPNWKEPQSDPIEIPPDPWANDPKAGIAEGDRVYHAVATCMSCHPSYHDQAALDAMGRALNLEAPLLRKDAQFASPQRRPDGTLILPPNFKRDWIKSGSDPKNLYRVISAGITTTAMPTWNGTLPPEQIWALAHYISSLAAQRPYRLDPATYESRPPVDLLGLEETSTGNPAPKEFNP